MSLFVRAIAVWLVIIGAETVHGTLRTLFLEPAIGGLAARQVSVLTGSVIIFVVVYLFSGWLKAVGTRDQILVGSLWAGLTIAFEIALGRFLLGYGWDRITEDYDPSRGGILWAGLLFLVLSPFLAVRVKNRVNRS